MAKKTKAVTASTAPKKKAVTKKSAAKKAAPKKRVAKKRVAKKSPAKKGTATKGAAKSKPHSVDGVLAKYENERVTLESKLSNLQKTIADLEKKTLAFQSQISKLSAQESVTSTVIGQLDTKRDAEVSAVLSKLGVSVSTGGSVPTPQETATVTTDEPKPTVDVVEKAADTEDSTSGESATVADTTAD